jgi:hypothetical protein
MQLKGRCLLLLLPVCSPGGDPTVAASQPTKCATDLTIAGRLWTEGEGASSIEDCVAPPGYRMDGSTVTECASGTYKDVSDQPQCVECLWLTGTRQILLCFEPCC